MGGVKNFVSGKQKKTIFEDFLTTDPPSRGSRLRCTLTRQVGAASGQPNVGLAINTDKKEFHRRRRDAEKGYFATLSRFVWLWPLLSMTLGFAGPKYGAEWLFAMNQWLFGNRC